jgi:hypothetical protein
MNLRVLLSLPLLLIATPALAEELVQMPSVIVYVQGSVKVIRGQETLIAALGTEVRESDSIVTEDNSQARVRLYDRSLLRLGANSRVQMAQLRSDASAERKTISVKLVVGRLWASVSKLLTSDSAFEVQTQSAVAGVRGTNFGASVDAEGECEIAVGEGKVEVKSKAGGEAKLIGAGRAAVVGLNGFRMVRDLGVAQTALLLDNARGNPSTGGAADKASDNGAKGANNKITQALDKARDRIAAENKVNNNNNQRGAQRDARDRQSEKKLGVQDAVEQRNRASDTFEKFNERAAATRLRAIIEVRE